ncbi:MAG TPA: LPD29 domain-containing protein [Candidatus Tectomicrobia bacterium]
MAGMTALPTGPRRHISTTETAKLIRAALKHAFPGITFSVRSKKYSGGSSIDVDWIDGPTKQEAEKVYQRFEGASFDGMIDLKSYHDTELNGELVHFGADYVFGNRNLSEAFLPPIAARIAAQYGVPVPEIQVSEYSGAYIDNDYSLRFDTRETGMEPLGTIIYRAAIQMSALPKPRVRITAIARPCAAVA